MNRAARITGRGQPGGQKPARDSPRRCQGRRGDVTGGAPLDGRCLSDRRPKAWFYGPRRCRRVGSCDPPRRAGSCRPG